MKTFCYNTKCDNRYCFREYVMQILTKNDTVALQFCELHRKEPLSKDVSIVEKILSFCGNINSEETYRAAIGNNKNIYVQSTAIAHQHYTHKHSEEELLFVDFWISYLDGRICDNENDYPTVWIAE